MITAEIAATLRPGDVLTYWHDSGAMGPQLCYAEFISTGKKREFLTVRLEPGAFGCEVVKVRRSQFDRKIAFHEWRPACFDRAGEFLENAG